VNGDADSFSSFPLSCSRGKYLLKARIWSTAERMVTIIGLCRQPRSALLPSSIWHLTHRMDRRNRKPHLVFNEERVGKTFNATEALGYREGRWQSAMHTETVIPGEIAGMKIDSKVYDGYVGKYRLTSAIIYTVRRVVTSSLGRATVTSLYESRNQVLKKRGFPDVLFRIIFVRNDYYQ